MTERTEQTCIVTGLYQDKHCVFIILTDDPSTIEERFVDIVENGDCTIIQCESFKHAQDLAQMFAEGTFYIGEDGTLVGDETEQGKEAAKTWSRITNCIKAGKK